MSVIYTFKDRLKERRKQNGISQQQLANAIFVSRSAVAKWENGLGLPGKASYEALLVFFETSADEFPLNEEIEIEVVKHNQKRHIIRAIVFWVVVLALSIAPIWMFSAVESGYGFTSEMAAGALWADDEVIHTDGYDIYYDTYANDDEKYAMINRFCIVEKRLFGYRRCDTADYKRAVYTDDGENYGYIYTMQDDDGYHHIFCSNIYMDQTGTYLYIVLEEVEIEEKTLRPYRSSYFVTKTDISDFYSTDKHFTIK